MATTLEILFEAEEIMREILNATRRDEFEEALRIVEGVRRTIVLSYRQDLSDSGISLGKLLNQLERPIAHPYGPS